MNALTQMGQRARAAARQLARATTAQKDAALSEIAARVEREGAAMLAANARDVDAAQAAGLAPALVDRLMLTPARLAGLAADVRAVVDLPDPVGEVFDVGVRPNGLRVHKQRVPLGVLGVIYEARPNVTLDVATLAVKTGNAVILRGGSETVHTNTALVALVRGALAAVQLPEDAVQFVEDVDRARVLDLLALHEYVDLLIPRGGAALHAFCREHSRIPVITGGIGICHLYVDASADVEGALAVIHNAKVQRPTVCNALDTVLVHSGLAAEFLPRVCARLGADGVTFRAAPRAWAVLAGDARVVPAGAADFDTEWLALILGLKVVDGLDEALAHIVAHSSGHSDGILTRDAGQAARFVAEVDSAAVYVNASTRFTDGSQLGLGAEVAISTQRVHARGPMGLRELTTYKWVIQGENHVRA